MKKISILFLIASVVALLGACTASTVIIDGRYTGTAEFNNGARADIDVYIKKQAVNNLLVYEYKDISVRKDGNDLGTSKASTTASGLSDTQDAIWTTFDFGSVTVTTGSGNTTSSINYSLNGTLRVIDNGLTFELINKQNDTSNNYRLRSLELEKK